jgi:hypothetical protein
MKNPDRVTRQSTSPDDRYGQNDRSVLVVQALANCNNRWRHLLFIDLLRSLNVDVGTDAAAAKLA